MRVDRKEAQQMAGDEWLYCMNVIVQIHVLKYIYNFLGTVACFYMCQISEIFGPRLKNGRVFLNRVCNFNTLSHS